MLYKNSQNIVFRVPYQTPAIKKYFKLKKQEFDLNINYVLNNRASLLSFENILLDKTIKEKTRLVQSSLTDIDTGIKSDIKFTYIRSKSHLHFYRFADQRLEINDFKKLYKTPHLTEKPELIQITNVGKDPIVLYSVEVDSIHFILNKPNFPLILDSKESLELNLKFIPKHTGTFIATIHIRTSIDNYPLISYDIAGAWFLGRSYYKIINKIRYDRLLLEMAYSYVLKSKKNTLQLNHIQYIISSAQDAYRVTKTEKRTLKYIWDHYKWSAQARSWFKRIHGNYLK